MAIKHTLMGLLTCAAIAIWLVALILYICRAARLADVFFAAGSAVLFVAFGARWAEVDHVPLQSLFEVFLCLGMLTFPLWIFCRKFLGARGSAGAVFIAIIMIFPAAFVFNAEPQPLPPALQSWLFIPHVATYMLAYMILALATMQAVMHLFCHGEGREETATSLERATYNMVQFGFPLLALGLVLGAIWGEQAWGDYWGWDPKELWSLATFMGYLFYLHFRAIFGARLARVNSALAILGGLLIVATLLWVNLAARFSGMHGYAT